MEGVIAHEPAGAGGFGYDPILMLPEYGKTSAEITWMRRMPSVTAVKRFDEKMSCRRNRE